MKSSIMKTVIPIDDSLMQLADDAARELGVSRSESIAEALRLYLRERRRIPDFQGVGPGVLQWTQCG